MQLNNDEGNIGIITAEREQEIICRLVFVSKDIKI